MDIENFESCLPATVKSIDGKGFITATPCIRKVSKNGVIDLENQPIPGIKLLRLGTPAFSIDMPLQQGDPVLLLAISRDSRKWKAGDWPVDVIPKSCSGGTLCDFVAVPLALSQNVGEKSTIKIAEDGTVTINGHLEIKP